MGIPIRARQVRNGGGHTGADGGWWLRCGESDAGFWGANGGGIDHNFIGVLLRNFELIHMAAIVEEASGSTGQALRGREVADPVRTSLAPRSQPTTALSKRHMPTLRSSFQRQPGWHGWLPLLLDHVRLRRSKKIRIALAFSATDQDDPQLHSELSKSCTRHAHRIFNAI